MTREETIKEMEAVIRDITNPYNDHDIEVEAWQLVEEDGWRRVPKGEWKTHYDGFHDMVEIICSNCLHTGAKHFKFCPNCGAKMRSDK